MDNNLLTRHEVAQRWKQSKQTIDRYRKLGHLPWIDLSGGIGLRPVVRFRLSDIEKYEEKMRMDPLSSDYKANLLQTANERSAFGNNNKADSENFPQPLSLLDEGPKLIRRFHASK